MLVRHPSCSWAAPSTPPRSTTAEDRSGWYMWFNPPLDLQRGYDNNFHVMLVGARKVGKRALRNRFIGGGKRGTTDFSGTWRTRTVGLYHKTVRLLVSEFLYPPNPDLGAVSLPAVHGYMVIYDVTSAESFRAVPDCISFVRQHAPKHAQVILVANKTDVQVREVSVAALREYASGLNEKLGYDETWILPVQTSAKDLFSVEYAFRFLADLIFKNIERIKRVRRHQCRIIQGGARLHILRSTACTQTCAGDPCGQQD
eukprot:TRINITY_DN9425_c0_g1_i7.p1 TRINITY_DN9425_c0_g1~~TRINITY_DN9425_c0_g1_i7.p1  ORF type:complete len:257 (-),score=26.93 TRINITY_DN9425_c0_g1_i7:172-942(-)